MSAFQSLGSRPPASLETVLISWWIELTLFPEERPLDKESRELLPSIRAWIRR
jgi:hypothetical protein